MNRSIESILRFINLTSSGLLAGSLGFGDAALMPGWEHELPPERRAQDLANRSYFNAIGPVALGTAVALAGWLAATIMVTVPINKELEEHPPSDYPSDRSHSLVRNWSRAHAVR